MNKLKKTMIECMATLCLILTIPVTFASHFINTPDDVVMTLIYPEQAETGQPVQLYLRLDNIGERSWRPSSYFGGIVTSRDSGYILRNCLSNCSRMPVSLEPGQTLFLPIGTLHPTRIEPTATRIEISGIIANLVTDNTHYMPTLASPFSIALTYNPAKDPLAQLLPERLPLDRRDFLGAGDQLIVHDPNTGLDWLRPDMSQQLSTPELLAALEPGGVLDEFRLARTSEIQTALLNHINAAGMRADRHQLIYAPPLHLYPVIASFASLMAEQTHPEELATVSGVVADKHPPLYERDAVTLASISVGFSVDCADECESGLNTRGIPYELAVSPNLRAGAWLVRGPDLPERPLDQPSLFDGELWIPDLRLDGRHYQAVLKLTDSRLGIFELLELTPVSSGTTAINVNLATGAVPLANTAILNMDGTQQTVNLELVIVPGTTPQALQLVTPGVILD